MFPDKLPSTVAFHRRTPLISVKEKAIIVLALIFFSSISGVRELTLNIDRQEPALFLKTPSYSRVYTEKQKQASGSSVPKRQIGNNAPAQFQVLGIKSQKFAAPTAVPTKTPVKDSDSPWGVSKQIDEHTWTIKIEDDAKNATAREILIALNAYRQRHGKGALSWDDKLGGYAQSRADAFNAAGTLDSHKGFMDFVNNQDGFHKLSFGGLGENSSIGYTLEGVHLIEWVYAGDKPHDDNQLSSSWSHVGIGVSGTATDLVFGGNKL